MGTVSEYVTKQYGVLSYIDERFETVPADTLQYMLLPINPLRYNLLIINNSPYDVYIATSERVGKDFGIKLSKHGGIFACDAFTDMTLASNMWYAYADGGDVEVYIITNNSIA